jgi:hypothetical protein
MKKWFIIAVVFATAFSGFAAPKKELTLQDWLKKTQTFAEKKGKEYNEEKETKIFNRKDKDGDGILSIEEQAPKK